MKIGVVGTGYVGLVTGTCLAHLGHSVTAIDVDQAKVQKLNEGIVPIYEPGLDDLLVPLIKNKKISFSSELLDLKNSEVIFIAVGTPATLEGNADLSYVFTAVKQLKKILNHPCVLVLKSTVPVGTAKKVKEILGSDSVLKIASNPEFLKEGAALQDFLFPDRIVVGAAEHETIETMYKVYAPILEKHQCAWIATSNVSAEMIKYAANCFLAIKISFINEIAYLCEKSGANVEEVKVGIGTDKRIGQHFLNPGPGYGGSCFPKDVKALLATARDLGASLQVVQAAEKVNEVAKTYAAKKLLQHFDSLKGKKIALWGLAFKANTDDVRESSAFDTVAFLQEQEVSQIFAFDPIAAENFYKFMPSNIQKNNIVMTKTAEDAILDVDALLIMTEWDVFKQYHLKSLAAQMKGKLVIDCRNLYDIHTAKDSGLNYISIGRP